MAHIYYMKFYVCSSAFVKLSQKSHINDDHETEVLEECLNHFHNICQDIITLPSYRHKKKYTLVILCIINEY